MSQAKQGNVKPEGNTEAKRKTKKQNIKSNFNEREIKEQEEVEEQEYNDIFEKEPRVFTKETEVQEYADIPENEPQMIIKDVHSEDLLMEPNNVGALEEASNISVPSKLTELIQPVELAPKQAISSKTLPEELGTISNVTLRNTSYDAVIRKPFSQEPFHDDQEQYRNGKDFYRNNEILGELQKQSMVASKTEYAQYIEDIFNANRHDDQGFLNLINTSVDIWMKEWGKKRCRTDRNLQWNNVYGRIHYRNPLPVINEISLINADDPDALGWRLAHAFTECYDLQEYICLSAQVIEALYEKSVNQMYLFEVVESTINYIIESPAYMDAVETFITCIHYLLVKMREENVDNVDRLVNSDARDIATTLKSLLKLPISSASASVSISVYQGGLDNFNQLMSNMLEVISHNDISYRSIKNIWNNIKINKVTAESFYEQVKDITKCLFAIYEKTQDNDTYVWDPREATSKVISLLEPFQGSFAPLQIALIKQLCSKVFINIERKYPTLQVNYYSLLMKQFPALCEKHGPLLIEHMEVFGVGGYHFTLNDVEIDLSNAIPKRAWSNIIITVDDSASKLYKKDITTYEFANASLACKVPHFEYKKVEGIPPWEDSGEAAIDIKKISFQVKIQTISEEYLGFSTQVLSCRCNIGHMDIHIKKSQYPEFLNALALRSIKTNAKARLEQELSDVAQTFFKKVFSVKLF
ncbi:hypothetical protein BCV72DRAFT_12999 [Rhizopus microsporus var. microsporus]|uniref:Uncharacterized protein n=1 Tax=Rhizopus microsporus var. microsporus TaxID=86635 RepID=A0A1X0QXW6_RHIZD|nr:hypothetical protein BCV72DRAFT_12999 [Rhizopus microsporus var. microsporus]